MKRLLLATLLFGTAALVPAIPVHAQPCSLPACAEAFPANAGAINVRDYGAKGDGRTDDTSAIRQAIAASGQDTGKEVWHDRVVFLPAGTYLVSDTLTKHYIDGGFGSGLVLVGEAAGRTTIRLKDGAAGFENPLHPRAVIMTTSKRLDRGGGRDYERLGEGNDAYENFVENLTIDVGHNNPGAIGIDYLANNLGAIRDVTVRAPEGSGHSGISMLRKWPGPLLVQRVSVEGFETGLEVANTEYGITLSQVLLTGQRRVGLLNQGNEIAAQDLTIRNGAGTALMNRGQGGMIVLDHGLLPQDAIENSGTIVFHQVHLAPGRQTAIVAKAGIADGWLAGMNDWHAETAAWSLPMPQAPMVEAGPVAQWVGVTAPPEGAASPIDSTQRLQAAFNSGAQTVYLQNGIYWISTSLEVPSTLHRIVGMNATLRVLPARQSETVRKTGIIHVAQAGPPLMIERLAMDNTDQGNQSGIVLSAPRQLVLRDVFSGGVVTLDRQQDGGEAFLEDTCCGTLHLAGPREVVARQLNTEGSGIRILNQSAKLAVLGIKTEQECTVAQSEAGAKTQILGGLIYLVRTSSGQDVPAFITNDSQLAASFAEESVRPDSHYTTYLLDHQAGRMRRIDAASRPLRGFFGRIEPLLWAGEPPKAH